MTSYEWKVQELTESHKVCVSASQSGNGCANKQRTKKQRTNFSFFHCPYVDFQQKVQHRLKVCLPVSSCTHCGCRLDMFGTALQRIVQCNLNSLCSVETLQSQFPRSLNSDLLTCHEDPSQRPVSFWKYPPSFSWVNELLLSQEIM